MQSHVIKSQRGYVALFSVIAITSALTAAMFGVATSGFYSRFNVLASEHKEASMALAEGCAQAAILYLSQDASYQGAEEMSIADHTCQIESVVLDSDEFVIKVSSDVKNAVSKIVVRVDSTDLSVLAWSEVAQF